MNQYNVFSGAFSSEQSQRFLMIMHAAADKAFHDLYVSCMPQNPKKYRDCLERVTAWDTSLISDEMHALTASYPDMIDMFKHVYVEYVKTMRGGSHVKLLVSVPKFANFLHSYYTNFSRHKQVRDYSFFNSKQLIDQRIVCMDALRDSMFQFLGDDHVKLEDRSVVSSVKPSEPIDLHRQSHATRLDHRSVGSSVKPSESNDLHRQTYATKLDERSTVSSMRSSVVTDTAYRNTHTASNRPHDSRSAGAKMTDQPSSVVSEQPGEKRETRRRNDDKDDRRPSSEEDRHSSDDEATAHQSSAQEERDDPPRRVESHAIDERSSLARRTSDVGSEISDARCRRPKTQGSRDNRTCDESVASASNASFQGESSVAESKVISHLFSSLPSDDDETEVGPDDSVSNINFAAKQLQGMERFRNDRIDEEEQGSKSSVSLSSVTFSADGTTKMRLPRLKEPQPHAGGIEGPFDRMSDPGRLSEASMQSERIVPKKGKKKTKSSPMRSYVTHLTEDDD